MVFKRDSGPEGISQAHGYLDYKRFMRDRKRTLTVVPKNPYKQGTLDYEAWQYGWTQGAEEETQ